jgi:hypothetical protein
MKNDDTIIIFFITLVFPFIFSYENFPPTHSNGSDDNHDVVRWNNGEELFLNNMQHKCSKMWFKMLKTRLQWPQQIQQCQRWKKWRKKNYNCVVITKAFLHPLSLASFPLSSWVNVKKREWKKWKIRWRNLIPWRALRDGVLLHPEVIFLKPW